jgi:uncharacterized protein YjbJ (UPF0337 family)
MDRNRVEGKIKQAKGAAKDALGGMTGNTRMQASGKLDKVAGRVQEGYGKAKDDINASRKGDNKTRDR